MTYTYRITIDAALDRVTELIGDPANRLEWMDGIEEHEPLSGEPGRSITDEAVRVRQSVFAS